MCIFYVVDVAGSGAQAVEDHGFLWSFLACATAFLPQTANPTTPPPPKQKPQSAFPPTTSINPYPPKHSLLSFFSQHHTRTTTTHKLLPCALTNEFSSSSNPLPRLILQSLQQFSTWWPLLVSIWEPPIPAWVSSEMTVLRSLRMTRETEQLHHS